MDLRERIIAAWEDGERDKKELARRFRVGYTTVRRYIRQWLATGSVAPKPPGGGRPRRIIGEALTRLEAHLEEEPDATLEERREELGLNCCVSTVWNTLQRLEQA